MVHVFPKTSPPIVPNRKTTKIFTVTILTHTHTKKKKKKLSIASGGEACSSNRAGSVEGSQDNEWNRSEIDGPFCPICMKSWTNDGDHYIWTTYLEHTLGDMQSRESGLANVGGHYQGRPVFGYSFGLTFCGLGSPYSFILQAAGWSCKWDLSSSHYINAGLQNGSLLVFDMRQTVGPVNSLKGLTRNPVHMADSLLHSSTLTSSVSSVLSASSICCPCGTLMVLKIVGLSRC